MKVFAMVLGLASLILISGCTAKQPPRLTVFIAVDQLAASILERQADRFEDGGFLRVMRSGAWFPRTRVPHAHTETVVGHSTLATGTYPSSHGMIANSWYSRERGTDIKAFESEDKPVCGSAKTGYAPAQLGAGTIGDKLLDHTDGEAKVFAISGKARSGVALGGGKGKAFWFDGRAKGFVTSTYYFPECPSWVEAWHARDSGAPTFSRYKNKFWELSHDPDSDFYVFDPANEYPAGTTIESNMVAMDVSKFLRAFNHPFGSNENYYYNFLTSSPAMDELIADFALEIVRNEELGLDAVPDILSIGFSANDAVLHLFGPSSRESEDIVYWLDRTLARLFSALDEQVGADNLLIVLSADHGGGDYPAIYRARDKVDAEWIPKDATQEAVEAAFEANGWPKDLVTRYKLPYIYLDHARIEDQGLEAATVLAVVQTAIRGMKGIEDVVATAALTEDNADEVTRRILYNQAPSRSGDLYVVRNQYWQQSNPGGPFDLLQHGSVWPYDSIIPLGFHGPGVRPGVIRRDDASQVDVFPTLGTLLGLELDEKLPGTPLSEALAE